MNGEPNGAVRIPVVYSAFWHNDTGYIVMERTGEMKLQQGQLPNIGQAVGRVVQIPSPTSVWRSNAGPLLRGVHVLCLYDSVERLEERSSRGLL